MTITVEAPAAQLTTGVTMTIIATETCARCKMIAGSLERKGREFVYALKGTHPADHADAAALGYQTAPVTLIRDADGRIIDHWPMYRPDKITAWVSSLPITG